MPVSNTTSKERTRFPVPLWKIIGTAFLIGVIALFWIRKEVYHDKLSRQVLALEKKETELLAETGKLQREHLFLSESSRIEKLAKERLDMDFPKEASDTVWITNSEQR